MTFSGSVGPCPRISGTPKSARAEVVTYQGIRGILEPLRVGCRFRTAVPESLSISRRPRNFGALAFANLALELATGKKAFVEALCRISDPRVVDLQKEKPSWRRWAEFGGRCE